MKLYDDKTPERLSILAAEMIVFMLWFNTVDGPIGFKLASTGFFMTLVLILITPEVLEMPIKESLMILTLPVGLIVSGIMMSIDYREILESCNFFKKLLKEHYLEVLWLLAIFLVANIIDSKTKVSR